MGKPHRRIPVKSRVMNAHTTACYIGVSDSKFSEMRKMGEFPIKSLPYGPYWDQRAVDQWLDMQSGLTTEEVAVATDGAQEEEGAWIKAAQEWPG